MKKKAPPKKKPGPKPTPKPPVADVEALVRQLPAIPEGKVQGLDWIREECKLIYTLSVEKVSLQDLCNHPRFKGQVSLKALQDWCQKESWVELRRQTAESWRVSVTEATGRELIEARREWLGNLKVLGKHIFDQLLPDKKGKFQLEAQSYESMAQAFVKVVGLLDTMTQNSLDDVLPEPPQNVQASATEKSEVALKPDLTPEEARAGAHAILKLRLAEQRRLAAAHAERVAAEKKG